jgi:hypothetical protein
MRNFVLAFTVIFLISCGNSSKDAGVENKNDSAASQNSKVDSSKSKTCPAVQTIWESYNYYKNGQTEYIIEESFPGNEKVFYYYTSNTPHQYDIPNAEIKYLEVKNKNDNKYTVSFQGGNKTYRLIFKGNTMDCIDNRNIQTYSNITHKMKEEFDAVFKSFKVYNCIGDVEFEEVKTKKLYSFPLGTFYCADALQDNLVNGCDYKFDQPGEGANKKFIGHNYHVIIERGLCSKGTENFIGDFAIIY